LLASSEMTASPNSCSARAWKLSTWPSKNIRVTRGKLALHVAVMQ
jgi:hypothetical protein